MLRLLDLMPFSAQPDEVVVRGERIRIRADQIVVWVSLGRSPKPNGVAIPFPAILDTGYTHSFALTKRHLAEWAGFRPEALPVLGAFRERGQRILLRVANVWVHANERGRRDRFADRPPHRLEVRRGIAVYPGRDFPRLPLLGLRAVAENGLILNVRGTRREATLRTPLRWWPFA